MKTRLLCWALSVLIVSILVFVPLRWGAPSEASTPVLDGFTTTMRQTTPADALAPAAPNEVLGFAMRYNGATWDRDRTPIVFKPIALTAATAETTIWTPTSGKKFRLMGFTLTCGAGSTLTFKDNTGGTTVFAARGGTDVPISVQLGNGILSGAINRVLTVTRGTSATLDGTVWGTEE